MENLSFNYTNSSKTENDTSDNTLTFRASDPQTKKEIAEKPAEETGKSGADGRKPGVDDKKRTAINTDPVLILDEKYKNICRLAKTRDIRPFNSITGMPNNSQEQSSLFPDDSIRAFSNNYNITEGFNNIVTEGFDSKDAGKIIKPYLKILYNLTESPLRYINYMEERITYWYATKLSGGKCSLADKKLVKAQFQVFLNVLISCYIVYNWYYMMFYKPSGGDSRVKPLLKIKTYELTEYNKFISLFFKYTIVPVSILNYVLMEYIPGWEQHLTKLKVLTQRSVFVLLFLYIINVIQHDGSDIIDGFVKSLHMKTDSYNGMFIASYFFFGIYSQLQVEPDFMNIRSIIKNILSAMNPVSSLGRIFLFFIRFAWTSAISFVSGFLVYSYLLVMSFFAILIHSSGSIDHTIKQINAFIENPHRIGEDKETKADKLCSTKNKSFSDMPEPPSVCNPMNIFQRISYYAIILFYTIIKYGYKFIFEIALIISVLKSISVYTKKIENSNLRNRLIITCCVIITILCGHTANRYFSSMSSTSGESDTAQIEQNDKPETKDAEDESGIINSGSSVFSDFLEKSGVGGIVKEKIDMLNKYGVGESIEKNFDKLSKSGMGKLIKEKFETLSKTEMEEFIKGNLDMLKKNGLDGLIKENFDTLIKPGVGGIGSETIDSLSKSGINKIGENILADNKDNINKLKNIEIPNVKNGIDMAVNFMSNSNNKENTDEQIKESTVGTDNIQ